jgi:hypothetical protein
MKNIKIFITTALACGLTACTDVLDTSPYNQIATTNMWSTEALTEQGVAGIYAALRDWTPYNGGWTSGAYGFDSWGMTGQHQYAEEMLNGSVQPGYYVFSGTWQKTYEGIHRANDAIKNIPSSPVSDERKGKLIAEAKFLRAYYYLRLNTLFGGDGLGVPLYLEPIIVDECTQGQAPEQDVWAQIIKDLTDCIGEPNFPNTDFTEGRATKGAAYALRGKAYLIQGVKYSKEDGSRLSTNPELLEAAVKDFEEVGKSGYELFQGGYKQLFTEANEHCKEMIFSIQNVAEAGYGNLTQLYCGTRSAHSTEGTNCWGDYQVSPDLVDLYEVVENGVARPFSWDDIISGYSTKPVDQREIYFLRDTLDQDKDTLKYPQVLAIATKSRLTALASVASEYLPRGNEARVMKAYENRDPRLQMSVITPYSGTFKGYNGVDAAMELVSRWPVSGGSAQPSLTKTNDLAINKPNVFYYWHRKFVYEGFNVVHRERCPINDPLIRYADVVLMCAEALVELDRLPDAAARVNLVRNRISVDMPNVVYSNQADLRAKVRDERRREFVNEGVNFFDEMRWRTWKQTKFKGGTGGQTQKVWGDEGDGSTYKWAGDYVYNWPVPRSEVERNPNLKPTPGGWSY